MTHKMLPRFSAALCALLLLLALCPAAYAASAPAESNNQFDNDYSNLSHSLNSHLYANSSGGLTRVEYITPHWDWEAQQTVEEKLIVEDYTPQFALVSSRTLPLELSYYCGFYAGSEYNFVFFGQSNPDEDNSREVLRAVKYDKSWNRLGQASICGANTLRPEGALRCAESGGYLYVHTAHTMYRSDDGLNHQANLSAAIRESDMSVTNTLSGIGGYPFYTSHSMNQFILAASNGSIVTANHGDSYPRAMEINIIQDKAGKAVLYDSSGTNIYGYVQTEKFFGANGDNWTAAHLGGLAETANGFLLAYSQGPRFVTPNQIKLAYVAKKGFHYLTPTTTRLEDNVFQIQELTGYTDYTVDAGCPMLVPVGLDGGYVLWNTIQDFSEAKNQGFHYAAYDANGKAGPYLTIQGVALSDCQPILFQGKIVWYTTTDYSAPVFYSLDDSGVTITPANGAGTYQPAYLFSDVSTAHWAYGTIREAVASGLAAGTGNNQFQPSGDMTAAQFSTFLARAFYGAPASSGTSPWYQLYTDSMQDHSILRGVNFNATAPISRCDMAQMLYNVLKDKGAAIPSSGQQAEAQRRIQDWSAIPENYRTAVSVCYAAGLIGGMEDGTFSGSSVMSRAQGCTVLSRALQYIPQTPAETPDDPVEAEDLSPLDQFRNGVIRLINEERAEKGLSTLKRSEDLTKAAQIRAKEVSTLRDSTRPDGTKYETVLTELGITNIGWRGELYFWGTFSEPEQVKTIWTNSTSPTIRNNLDFDKYTHVGIGRYHGADGMDYCVQLFGEVKE